MDNARNMTNYELDLLADKVARRILARIENGMAEEWVPTAEAAAMVGCRARTMRKNKDEYEHIQGENGRLLFRRASLINGFRGIK